LVELKGKIALDEAERDILKLAGSGEELRFGDFIESGRHAKATVVKYLHRLIDEGLIEETLSIGKQRPRRRVYHITDKGMLAIFSSNTEAIRRSLESLEVLTTFLLSKPKILDEWRKSTRAVVRGIAETKGLSLEEILEGLMAGKFEDQVKLAQKERDAQFGSFRKVLRNMHQISLRLFASPSEIKAVGHDVYLHVNDNGIIDVLAEDEPIKHADIAVKSM
jgi:DNA-binding PadR family transcriptional regulator